MEENILSVIALANAQTDGFCTMHTIRNVTISHWKEIARTEFIILMGLAVTHGDILNLLTDIQQEFLANIQNTRTAH